VNTYLHIYTYYWKYYLLCKHIKVACCVSIARICQTQGERWLFYIPSLCGYGIFNFKCTNIWARSYLSQSPASQIIKIRFIIYSHILIYAGQYFFYHKAPHQIWVPCISSISDRNNMSQLFYYFTFYCTITNIYESLGSTAHGGSGPTNRLTSTCRQTEVKGHSISKVAICGQYVLLQQ
jgi:hypothetical protein